MSNNQKESLRKTCLKIRKSLSVSIQKSASKIICDKISANKEYHFAKNVGLYIAHNNEIDLSSLWADNQKKYYFPKTYAENKMSFLPATNSTSFVKNKWGILEPDVAFSTAFEADMLDVIVIPIVAFDAKGRRVGMGNGYYDIALAKNNSSLLIGVAYEFQKQSYIQSEPWDINMDIIITEHATYGTRL